MTAPSTRPGWDALFEHFARITKGLASPRRLKSVEDLAGGRVVEARADA